METVLSQVAHVREQDSHTPLTSTVVPCGHDEIHVVPDLTSPVAHVAHVVTVDIQVAHVASHSSQTELAVFWIVLPDGQEDTQLPAWLKKLGAHCTQLSTVT